MTSETSLLVYVSCHQSYGIGLTFINPVLFLDSSFIYLMTILLQAVAWLVQFCRVKSRFQNTTAQEKPQKS